MNNQPSSIDRVLKGFEEWATVKPKPQSLPKKVVKAGIATVAGLFICTGFGLMIAASSSPKDEAFHQK